MQIHTHICTRAHTYTCICTQVLAALESSRHLHAFARETRRRREVRERRHLSLFLAHRVCSSTPSLGAKTKTHPPGLARRGRGAGAAGGRPRCEWGMRAGKEWVGAGGGYGRAWVRVGAVEGGREARNITVLRSITDGGEVARLGGGLVRHGWRADLPLSSSHLARCVSGVCVCVF